MRASPAMASVGSETRIDCGAGVSKAADMTGTVRVSLLLALFVCAVAAALEYWMPVGARRLRAKSHPTDSTVAAGYSNS